MNKPQFYDIIRKSIFNDGMTKDQVLGCEVILKSFNGMDPRFCAYALATAYHETAKTMQPVIETRQPNESSNPSVDTAIARLERSWAAGKMPWVKTPYWRKDENGKSWLGRGFVQQTWKKNYERSGKRLGVDMVGNPDLALEPDIAAAIMLRGMTEGWFTGKKLSDYITPTRTDYLNARRIINGTEKAALIAGYAKKFDDALYEAGSPRGQFINIKDEKPITQSNKNKATATIAVGAGVNQGSQSLGNVVEQSIEALAPAYALPGVENIIATLALVGAVITIGGIVWHLVIRAKDGGWNWPWKRNE